MPHQITAIIPARGGSKGIPGKNKKDFCGKPLVAWTILQARHTHEVDGVYVSSDSDEILEIASSYGAGTIKRPAEFATDTASSESAVIHALQTVGIPTELGVLIEPTSLLRKPDDLSRAIHLLRENQWDSCLSGAVLRDFLTWKKNPDGTVQSVNYDYKNRSRRQEREPLYLENGSIFLFRPEILFDNNNRLGGKFGIYLMDFWQSFEIDDPQDWEFIETLFREFLYDDFLKIHATLQPGNGQPPI